MGAIHSENVACSWISNYYTDNYKFFTPKHNTWSHTYIIIIPPAAPLSNHPYIYFNLNNSMWIWITLSPKKSHCHDLKFKLPTLVLASRNKTKCKKKTTKNIYPMHVRHKKLPLPCRTTDTKKLDLGTHLKYWAELHSLSLDRRTTFQKCVNT